LFLDPTYKRIHPDYTNYTQRFENKEIVSEAVERVKKRMSRNENNMIE
jgi:methylglyoxal synthase